jgi:hydrogenase nickel incorporation protein HypB
MPARIVEVRKNILKDNDVRAAELRERFRDAGVFVVSLVSSPGAGKTLFLEATLRALSSRHRVAALVGDLATENDAQRLGRTGVAVRQITTGTVCHLDAQMINGAIDEWNLSELDFLFIENVGNLVCPSSYDLGEHLRVVLLSVTEGEDKPAKYPTIFNTADLAVITKIDLVQAVEFRREDALRHIQAVRPGLNVLDVSAKTGNGMERWLTVLSSHASARPAARMAVRVERRLTLQPATNRPRRSRMGTHWRSHQRQRIRQHHYEPRRTDQEQPFRRDGVGSSHADRWEPRHPHQD